MLESRARALVVAELRKAGWYARVQHGGPFQRDRADVLACEPSSGRLVLVEMKRSNRGAGAPCDALTPKQRAELEDASRKGALSTVVAVDDVGVTPILRCRTARVSRPSTGGLWLTEVVALSDLVEYLRCLCVSLGSPRAPGRKEGC
jgi:hypothetical protein